MGVAIERSAARRARANRRRRAARDCAHRRKVLDLGNSGTAIRSDGSARGTSRSTASSRGTPRCGNGRWSESLRRCGAMGARITTRTAAGRRSPSAAAARLHGIDYALPMASAQVKSALLLAALSRQRHDDGPLAGPEPRPHRAHAAEHGRAARALSTARRRAHGLADRPGHAARLRSATCRRISARRHSSSSPVASARATGLLIENVGINPTRIGSARDPARDGRRDRAAQRALRRRRARCRSLGACKASSRGIAGAGRARAARDRRVPDLVHRRRGGERRQRSSAARRSCARRRPIESP